LGNNESLFAFSVCQIISMNQTEPGPLATGEHLGGYASSSNSGRYLDDRHPLDYLDLGTIHALNTTAINTSDLNETASRPLDPVLIDRFLSNRAVDSPWYHMLISMYGVLILFGALGNTLVVIAVVRKPIMRTARNLFILNLAISGELEPLGGRNSGSHRSDFQTCCFAWSPCR